MKIGEVWAHRARQHDPLARVRIETIGVKRPLRVKVKFLDDEQEGRSEWIPPSQLKSVWQARERYLHSEEAWTGLTAPFKGHLADEDDASQWIFDGFIDPAVVERLGGKKAGVIEVRDWTNLRALTGLTVDEMGAGVKLEGHLGRLLAWPAAVTVAKAYLEQHATQVLGGVARVVEEAHRNGSSGYFVKGTHGEPDRYIGPTTRNYVLEGFAPIETTLREWAGLEKTREVDEIRELRNALAETAAMMNQTVRQLLEAKQTELAWTIHRWLYPDADPRRWRAILKKEAFDADKTWREWLSELHHRHLGIQVQTEIAMSQLHGQEPARWAWTDLKRLE